jgi:hypothetical protein
VAVNGVIDLSSWDFEKDGSVPIIGDWHFHWKELITPDQARQAPAAQLTHVPGFWDNLQDLNRPGEEIGPYGYATYRMEVRGLTPGTTLGLRMFLACTAYELYWVESTGRASSIPLMNAGSVRPDGMIPEFILRTGTVDVKSTEATILLYVGNEHITFGGLPTPLTIDTAKGVIEWENNWLALGSASIAIMLVMFVYHLILFGLYRQDRASLGGRFIAGGKNGAGNIAGSPVLSWAAKCRVEPATQCS